MAVIIKFKIRTHPEDKKEKVGVAGLQPNTYLHDYSKFQN